jgi:Metallo-peptidase family M12/FG-GAP-like repeat/FG-GAP repeat
VLESPSSHKLLTSTALLLVALSIFAYCFVAPTASSQSRIKQDLDRRFLSSKSLQVDAAAMASQVRRTGRMSLATSDLSFDLELTPHDMRAPGYRAEEFGSDGAARPVDTGPVRTFKGVARGTENGATLPQLGQARFTIDENGIQGLIITPAQRYFVEPTRNFSKAASDADYVIYRELDVVGSSSGACGVTMSEQVNHKAESVGAQMPGEKSQQVSAAASLQELRVATEADYEYVSAAGAGSPDAAKADRAILSILNQVEGLYEIELGLTLKVVYQSAWSTPSQPYSSTNPSALLGELTSYWNSNRGSVARDLVHMWTAKNLDNATIGTAYLDALCRDAGNGRAAYGLSKGVTGAQQIAITAHEIGHNLGATHPNQQVPPVAECNNTVMSSSVSTNPQLLFCQYSVDEIERYLSTSSSCLTAGFTQLSFDIASHYPVGGAAYSVAVGDFNGDGKQDLVTANFDGNTVSVLLGSDNDTFQPAVNYSVGDGPGSVAVGNFNGDEKQDIVVGNRNSNDVSVLLGNGDGTFQAAVNYPVGSVPYSVAVGDFNGDRKQDLVVANYGSNNVSVLLGNGDGTFQAAVNYPVGGPASSVAVGDFNGDGKQDLAVQPFASHDVSVMLGNGDGSFQPAVNYSIDNAALSVAVGDFNGDGREDLVVAGLSVRVLLGNGDGTFDGLVYISVASNDTSLTVGDFNGDGKQDLATGNMNNTVTVWLGTGNVTFQATFNYLVNSMPASIAVGDFNGDGKQDLFTANTDGDVTVLLGKGSGLFKAARLISFSPGAPLAVAVGDFNGDGKPDLAVANNLVFLVSNDVSVLLGNGDGSFQPAVNYPVGSGAYSVAVGDFNGDTKPDLAVANNNSNDVSVLLGNGDGSFQPAVSHPAGSGPSSVAAGDFNGDGKPDLAVANNVSNDLSVLLGNGDGSFQPAVNHPVGSGPISVAAGDFNGDGKLDLAVANYNSNDVSVLLGNGDGSFQPAVSHPVGSGPLSVAAGDFNGDGRQDLAVANQGTDNVSVLLGNGDGSLHAAVNYAVRLHPQSVAVGDFNSDGKEDLVTISPPVGVSVLLGKGTGDFQSAIKYEVGGFGSFAVAVGDFNIDGKPDLVIPLEENAQLRFITSLAVVLNTSGFSLTAPFNDNFSDARVISGPTGTIGGSTVLATKEPGEPNHVGSNGGTSIWYRWTAPASERFYFQTFGSSFPTVIAIYTGASVDMLTSVVSSSSSVPEYVEFTATPGTTYQIAIDGVTGDTGSTVLNWNTGSLSNDNFPNAREIRGTSSSVNGDNTNFTLEPGEPMLPGPPGVIGGFSAWYRWTAPNTGKISFSVTPCGSTTYLLGAYTGNFPTS